MRLSIYFNVHLVSDSTGETLNAVMRAAAAQFDRTIPLAMAPAALAALGDYRGAGVTVIEP